MKLVKGALGVLLTGAATVYLFDPTRGPERRTRLRRWVSQTRERNGDTSRTTSSLDVAPRPVIDPIPEGATNDPTLVARVESELFRDSTLPKGEITIDAAGGVVSLRGTLGDDVLADDIVERVQAIDGVARVVDLLQRR